MRARPRHDARLGAVAARALRLAASAPFSLLFAAAIVVAAILTGLEPENGWAASADATLSRMQWWTPLSSLVGSASLLGVVVAVLLSLSALVWAERALGTLRTVGAVLIGGALAVTTGVFAEAGIARWPGLSPAEGEWIASPTVGMVVAVTAASGGLGTLWRRRVVVLIAVMVALFALYSSDPASWVRLVSFGLGLALSWRWYGVAKPLVRVNSSLEEHRRLVSGFVALVGLGPLAGLLSGGGRGPIAHAAELFADVDRRLVARCAVQDLRICDNETVAVITHGAGPALLAAVPLALLVVAAVGLRSGRRAGWFMGLGTSALLAAAAIVAASTGSVVVGGAGVDHVLEAVLWGASAIGLPIAVVLVLLSGRRSFAVRAPRREAVRLAVDLAVVLVVLAGGYLLAEFLLRADWNERMSGSEVLDEALGRFLPQSLLYDTGAPAFPHRGAALVPWGWVDVIFWIVVICGVLWLYRRVAVAGAHDRGAYVKLLRDRDAGSLGWIGTWEGVSYWFAPGGAAAVAYRLVSGVALAISDPACSAEDRQSTLSGFIHYANEHGMTPVFYSVHEDTAAALRELGFSDMTVAEEAVLDLETWSMAGKAGEKVRQPYTRAQREGLRMKWCTFSELTPRENLALRALSEEWVAAKALPEMGFTLGGLKEMQDDDVRLALALDAQDRIVGVTSWLPTYREGELRGYTLDVMRRVPDGPNGVMEFLIASVALRVREDGGTELSLSGAPLATSEPQEQGSVMNAVLGRVSGALEPLYGFHSLLRFKKKFRPVHRRMAMSYADPLQLPSIGLAVARAYLPQATRREALAMARRLVERAE
ncbi:bifunctional lysylphosphatidylglycerol flippase/synthetase MprF [Galactobacter valiniphilus]|uniref:bifunctional lysylphosphatidylglycerol flippase/synthetase MprF n=1 Tax=Galactobacter valiniphilus TaxID=2676122 RepID=UPI001313E53B|nr:DUF2156 domain-containing protein [Galactobacter valiniphilus]